MQKYTVKDNGGGRIDLFILEKQPHLSRSYVQKLSKQDKILVNGKPAKPSHKLKAGDKIVLQYDPSEDIKIPEIDLPIIYEDDDLLVIDKPAGVLPHSKGNFNPEATVASFIQGRSKKLGDGRDGIVHRLDRATSGVMIVAKSPEAQAFLQKEFASRRAHKTYVAIIEGHLKPVEAVIDMPIERNPKKPSTFRVGSNGKPAQTTYKALKSVANYDLVELKPRTGRTHQIRVHMSKMGHPIVGDTLYKGIVADRLFLHAAELKIKLPTGEQKTFSSIMPKLFNEYIKND